MNPGAGDVVPVVGPRLLPICPVCNTRQSKGHFYGTLCCAACKMFFRRVLLEQTVKHSGNSDGCHAKCKYCRFERCIQAGMSWLPFDGDITKYEKTDLLGALIFNLEHHEALRQFQLFNCIAVGEHDIRDLVRVPGPITFQLRPASHTMDLPQWVVHTGMTSINYLKKLPHINVLNEADQKSLLKHTFFEFSVLTDAMRAQERKQEYISFPDGTEVILPDAIGNPNFINGIRCHLAGRVTMLRVSIEEYLLLSAVLMCNPALSDISESGRGILSTYQNIYKSALFQHCLRTSSPARMEDLLSLKWVMAKTCNDINSLFYMNTIQKPRPELTNLPLYR